jgi:membrane protein DedA with SNARE-associated domain
MDSIAQNLTNIFYSVPEFFRYTIMFIMAFVEGVPILGTLFPGGTMPIIVGSLSLQGFVSSFWAILFITLGSFSGDMLGFYLGKHFCNHRWIKSILENEKHQSTWDLFDRHFALVVIFGKSLPVIRSTPSLFASARGVAIKKYALYSIVGSLLWAIVGMYGGKIIGHILGANVAVLLVFGLIILSGLYIVLKNIIRHFKNYKK